jgi:hypothetical protein
MGSTVGLLFGAFVFWNTIYLLRFGLFVLMATGASLFAIYPLKVIAGVGAVTWLGAQWLSPQLRELAAEHGVSIAIITLGFFVAMFFETELLTWVRKRVFATRGEREEVALDAYRLDRKRAFAIVYMSGDELSFHKLTSELLMTRLRILRDQLGSGGVKLLYRTHELPDDTVLARRLSVLYELEKRSNVTLWHPAQLVLAGEVCALRPELGLNLVANNAAEREELLATWHLRRWLVTMMSTAGHSQDTGINLVDIAFSLAREGFSANAVFYLIQNKYDNSDRNRPSQLAYEQGELGQRDKLATLLTEVAPGARAYNLNDWTPFGFKAGGLVGMDLVHEESLKLTNMVLLDRNATVHDLDSLIGDLKVALANPGVVIIIPGRSTTNTLTPVGQSSQLIEEGQRAYTRGVMLLGGDGAEALGTGWGNIQAVYYGRVQQALCNVNTSRMPLTTATRRNASFGDRCEGLIGFGPHAVGISEDIWGVSQAAHNAIGLGYRVRFARSRALWHKIRETWSHAEWLSAFPRWSGGYFQLALDPLMQQIIDAGSASVFAKEIRAGGGRFFLASPFALLSIMLMPLAIIWDLSPFVQILILLWNVGLVMNQVLTGLGLVAYLESTGFNRLSATAGMILAGTLAAWRTSSPSAALPISALGFLAGGFAMGLGRWLYYRGRDVILFGPQLVIHTLGQLVRQSLEFVLSGASPTDASSVNMAFRSWAGPREDRPFEPYANLVNLRTVVWVVGIAALVLNLFALANLDFLNVLLLLPSLMFSISAIVGPFLTHPKAGRNLGKVVGVPKMLGWAVSFAFYLIMAVMVGQGGGLALFALVLGVAVFARVAWGGLRYIGYQQLLQRLTKTLRNKLVLEGVAHNEAAAVAERVTREATAGPLKASAAVEAVTLSTDARAAVQSFIQEQVVPVLQRPRVDAEHQASRSRFACEFERSFVLGLFTFVWFFVVPMPGLLVFTAPWGYRLAMAPSAILWIAFGSVTAVLICGLISLIVENFETRSRKGLDARIAAWHAKFQAALRGGHELSPVEISKVYAMFTDIQTYYDQRSYSYVKKTLALVEQALKPGGLSGNLERKAALLVNRPSTHELPRESGSI